jgi:hypothetical protein
MRALVGVRLAEVTDGSSNTLLLGERPPAGRLLAGNWYTIAVPNDPAVQNDPDWAGAGIAYQLAYWPDGTARCRGPIRFGPGPGGKPLRQ